MNLQDDEDEPQNNNLAEDDNAQVEDVDDTGGGGEDPLLLAIDDLEGRVVSALDEVKHHPGIHDASSGTSTIHEEMAQLLHPVLEVAAHTGPSVARTYFRGSTAEGLDDAVEDVYERLVSDLVLPVLLEIAQSDPIAAKRGAALEFFRSFWKEAQKAGSWLDATALPSSGAAGPYGSGGSSSSSSHHQTQGPPLSRPTQNRRREKRLLREGEILRYWLQAAIACLTPGVLTALPADDATASRAVLAASTSLRPSLKHIVQRIKAADDRGANRLYAPVMKLIEYVLQKLLLSAVDALSPDNLMAACIKFVEIVVLCCSRKPQDPTIRRRGASTTPEDFSLEDLPEGHPVITRESLESIADYSFTVLRGFTLLGGQVKIDANVLSGMMMSGGSPSEQVVNILRPAALAYLELESNFPALFRNDANKVDPDSTNVEETANVNLDINLDRATLEYDFKLGYKPYSVAMNALSALATHRPSFFHEASICLSRRAVHPTNPEEGSTLLSSTAIKAINLQLKSSCLTLLRNALSVSTNSFAVLQKALQSFDMQAQAEKALSMAKQAHSLKTAGRAARNRATIYYEWEITTPAADGSDQRLTKRQRETDDALAKMRAAKAARGLGHGIQLPTSMTDAVDLILANLEHLPSKRPPVGSATSRKVPVTLEMVIDAIMTNGASLSQEEGRWYERDGGSAWDIDMDSENKFRPSANLLGVMELIKKDDPGDPEEVQRTRKLFLEQSSNAAADAFGRILTNAAHSRSTSLSAFGRSVAARLAFTLRGVAPLSHQASAIAFAKASISKVVQDADRQRKLEEFVDSYSLSAIGLVLDSTLPIPDHSTHSDGDHSIAIKFLTEALLQQEAGPEDHFFRGLYDHALEVHVASSVNASHVANDKPNDLVKKKIASQTAAALQRDIAKLPRLTQHSILQLASFCDIEGITKKATEANKKSSQQSVAEAAAIHAAKSAAEKRAIAALVILRDIAFNRDVEGSRNAAVEAAVGLAAGRFPSTPAIQDKALKLVMNVLFSRNETLAKAVIEAATFELELAAEDAANNYDEIEKANAEAENDILKKNPSSSWSSDVEKQVMDRMRKPAILFMALCVRRTDIISVLFNICSREKADVLSKTVRSNMSKLTRATATKHGSASIAFDVASMTGNKEIPLLLSFLENLATTPDQDLIGACFKIQDSKTGADGIKDPRYIVPVVAVMKRHDLIQLLSDFVMAEDKIFLAALVRMGARVARHALLFRDEPDSASPSLQGMTLCEQLVYLHKLDFNKANIPQKRYLSAIKLCLEDIETYNDRVVMSALDQISGLFLTGSEKLPLAFMRTCILVCTKHESLHTWISQVLLPRLIEGRIYDDARQWEGWMRCAHMLEESADSGVKVHEAIARLPREQLMQYQSKWMAKSSARG